MPAVAVDGNDDSSPLAYLTRSGHFHRQASGSRVSVSLTRCRNISKPMGAKPGLVSLRGDITTIKMDLKAEAKRLERLEATVQ